MALTASTTVYRTIKLTYSIHSMGHHNFSEWLSKAHCCLVFSCVVPVMFPREGFLEGAYMQSFSSVISFSISSLMTYIIPFLDTETWSWVICSGINLLISGNEVFIFLGMYKSLGRVVQQCRRHPCA